MVPDLVDAQAAVVHHEGLGRSKDKGSPGMTHRLGTMAMESVEFPFPLQYGLPEIVDTTLAISAATCAWEVGLPSVIT